MRCDNYFPRCGEPKETLTHAIFEFPPALQVWWMVRGLPQISSVVAVVYGMIAWERFNLWGRET